MTLAKYYKVTLLKLRRRGRQSCYTRRCYGFCILQFGKLYCLPKLIMPCREVHQNNIRRIKMDDTLLVTQSGFSNMVSTDWKLVREAILSSHFVMAIRRRQKAKYQQSDINILRMDVKFRSMRWSSSSVKPP